MYATGWKSTHFSIIQLQAMIGFRMFKNDRMFDKMCTLPQLQIFPFLMSRGVLSFGVIQNPKLPTANNKGAVNEGGGPVNNLLSVDNTSTHSLSHPIQQDI